MKRHSNRIEAKRSKKLMNREYLESFVLFLIVCASMQKWPIYFNFICCSVFVVVIDLIQCWMSTIAFSQTRKCNARTRTNIVANAICLFICWTFYFSRNRIIARWTVRKSWNAKSRIHWIRFGWIVMSIAWQCGIICMVHYSQTFERCVIRSFIFQFFFTFLFSSLKNDASGTSVCANVNTHLEFTFACDWNTD